MATTSGRRRGFRWDEANSELEIEVNGTKVLGTTSSALTITPATTITGALVASTGITVTTGGLTVTAGTLNIDGIADFAADLKINSTLTAGADGVGADGEQLTSGGAAAECDWAAAASLKRFKNLLSKRTDAAEVLELLTETPVWDFQYKRKGENGEHVMSTGDFKTVYTGIMSEDAPWAMHFGGKILNPITTFGYTVLAFKGLVNRVKALEAVA